VGDLVLVLLLALSAAGVVLLLRRPPSRRRPGARTVELVADHAGVRRRLADGRTESARWDHLVEVELVVTPVRTADGAHAFAVLAESDEVGCLVPLEVGLDREAMVEIARLPGFDVGAFERRLASGRRGREVMWRRDEDQLGGTGSAR
jgi:hypothetical protein